MGEISPLELPKFGMTMEEGVVEGWLISEGDSFSKGQPICTVESAKSSNELESPFDGTLRRIVADSGAELPVGALIGVAADDDVTDAEIDEYIASRTGGAATPEPAAAPAAAPVAAPAAASVAAPVPPKAPVATLPAPAPAAPGAIIVPAQLQGKAAHDVFATPHAHLFADEHNLDISKITGTGPQDRVSIADIHAAIKAAGGSVPEKSNKPLTSGKAARSHEDDSRVSATRHARSRAEELGVNLNDCHPSGTHDRVTVRDVEIAALQKGLLAPAQAAAPSVGAAPADATADIQSFEDIPMSSMRKTIGARLQASVLNSPHFRVTQDLDIDEMLKLRKQINAQVPQVRISVNDLLIKAVALALVEVPDVNVQYDEANQVIRKFAHADISVAVSIDNGLITPIVRSADTRGLSDISKTVTDLVTRAKTGRLNPDEFQGGTFSISNLGMFGVPSFDAIINPPQAAILAIGAARKVATFDDDNNIVPRTLLTVTLSSDHRVVDGALAARFLAELKAIVAAPAKLLV